MDRERVRRLSAVFQSADHWHMRADEMRTLADQARDSIVRAAMLGIAAGYDRLAKHADRDSNAADPMRVRMAADDDDAFASLAMDRAQGFILAKDVILDPGTRKSIAVIRDGQVFRDNKDGTKIATVLGSYLYDLKGNLVGYLHSGEVIDPSTQSMPTAFERLLEDDQQDK